MSANDGSDWEHLRAAFNEAAAARAGHTMLGPLCPVHGEADALSPASLFTLAESERRSGLLIIERPNQRGVVLFVSGKVALAWIAGDARDAGPSAARKIEQWQEGRVAFFRIPESALVGETPRALI